MNPRLLGASALALGATLASTGVAGPAAAQAVTTRAQASLAFAAPAVAPNPADTARWSVASAVVTARAVGRTATITVSSTSPVDCTSVRTTVAASAVTPVRSSCSGTHLSQVVTLTTAMVGQRVTVTGWLQADTERAQLMATAVTGTSASRVQAHANRPLVVPLPPTTDRPTTPPAKPSTPAPIGALVPIGTLGTTQVSLASANGQNEVWVGSTRHAGPAGTVWHASVDGSTVNLWVKQAGSLLHWQLAGQEANTTTLQGSVWREGGPGFWLAAPSVGGAEPMYHLHDWAGTERRLEGQVMATRGRIGEFTDREAVVWEGGMLVDKDVVLVPLDGRAPYTSEAFGGFLVAHSVDAAGVTGLTNTGTTVRVEYGRTMRQVLDVPAPAGISQVGRTASGSTVSMDATVTGNHVWVGTGHHDVPAGTVMHPVVEGNTVSMWIAGPTAMQRWSLDATTGATSSMVVPGAIRDVTDPALVSSTLGFWIDVPAQGVTPPQRRLYTWAGRLVTTDTYSVSVRQLQTGFTSRYAVVRIAGMTPPGVQFIPMGATAEPQITRMVNGWLLTNLGCDETGCTFRLGNTSGTVRIEPDKDPVYLP